MCSSDLLPFDEGMKREAELFQELLVSSESAAQRYYFFAEREAAKVLDVPADTPQRPIKTAGIIGAGTMGGGIAMNFANAGIPVTLLEVKQEALDRGLKTIRTNYENTAKRGGMKAEDVEKRMALITPTLSYDGLKDADVIIEAVFETMEVKEGVFKQLDAVAKPGAKAKAKPVAASAKKPTAEHVVRHKPSRYDTISDQMNACQAVQVDESERQACLERALR